MGKWLVIRNVFHDVALPIILALLTHQSIRLGTSAPAAPPPVDPPVFVLPPAPPAKQPQAPPPVHDPAAATGKLRTENSGCSATVLDCGPAEGEYYAISAAHCFRGGARQGSLTLRDGRSFQVEVARLDSAADVALLRFSGPAGLPTAQVAAREPDKGTPVWHQGWGVDRPGNKEKGRIAGPPTMDGRLAMRLSVSSGDSGAGVFRTDNGQLVSVVQGYSGLTTYGASVGSIRRLLTGEQPPGGCPSVTCPIR